MKNEHWQIAVTYARLRMAEEALRAAYSCDTIDAAELRAMTNRLGEWAQKIALKGEFTGE